MSAAPKDAATVLLLRDREAGGFEVFMVKRHAKSGFMGGAYVFPGGKVDPVDCSAEIASTLEGSGEEARQALWEPELSTATARGLFTAAIRETFEEAGALLTESTLDVDAMRARLRAGEGFYALLSSLGIRLRLSVLIPLARWITPVVEGKRFDTRFFVARVPDGQRPAHDEHETTEHAWLSPEEAVAAMERGDIDLPPPTLKTLLDLTPYRAVDEVFAYARSRPAPRILPVVTQVEGQLAILLPGDPLHPEPTAALMGATRFVLEQGRFAALNR